MVKLLVIADDFTGAMDTGVQFRGKGTVLRVYTPEKSCFDDLSSEVNVLIVDTESRHLPAQQAAQIVQAVTAEAVAVGVRCIYKKTDSGLRGNIGAELAAALKASGKKRLHFIPAYPQLGRITRNGIHYIDGVPVAQSVFGVDPFEPVRFSQVQEIIQSQTDIPAVLATDENLPAEGIMIFDAESTNDLHMIAHRLWEENDLQLLAGCAGFAAVLPELLMLEQSDETLPTFVPQLLTVCGSINPITLKQLDTAEAAGVPRIRLNVSQKLDASWLESQEAEAVIEAWKVLSQNHISTIIECDGLGQPEELERVRKALGLDLEQMRCRISQTMGAILKRLLDMGLDATLLVTGGDTVMAFMEQIGQRELIPLRELTSGVVLSQICYRGKHYNLMSKSGGFGTLQILEELETILTIQEKGNCVC